MHDACEHYPDTAAARGRLAAIELGPEAAPLMTADEALLDEGSLVGAARRLEARGLAEDAARILGQALVGRAAVWWVCRMAREEPGGPADRELAALEAAESWVRTPEQWRAYAAQAAAEAAGLDTPGGCAALAAFLAGESLAPPTAPGVAPPAHCPGVIAAGAAVLAARRRHSVDPAARMAAVLALGFAIAAGSDSWNEAGVAATGRQGAN